MSPSKQFSAANQSYLVFQQFLSTSEEELLVREALQCHSLHLSTSVESSLGDSRTASTACKLDLGIRCGGNLEHSIPEAVRVARRIFKRASSLLPKIEVLKRLCEDDVPLTGTALLYGTNASMKAHYDSPTQPGQREEWLCTMSCGLATKFRCNDTLIELQPRDVLVMDSMAVLHGVERVLEQDESDHCKQAGLPWPSRLGILLWQGRITKVSTEDHDALADVEGVDHLFRGHPE